MVGWHHQLNGHEFEQIPADSEGWGNLACCSPWGCKRVGHNLVTKPLPAPPQRIIFNTKIREKMPNIIRHCFCSVTKVCPTLCNPMDCSQVPLSIGFPRQEYWSGLPFPSLGHLPGVEPVSPAWQVASSLYYTVNLCCFSLLCIVVCIY